MASSLGSFPLSALDVTDRGLPAFAVDPFTVGTPGATSAAAADDGRIDLAVFNYLLNETQERFQSKLPQILAKAGEVAGSDPSRISKLNAYPSEHWQAPWKRLDILTSWLAKVDRCGPAPSQRYKELRHPSTTRVEVVKEKDTVVPIAANRVGENCIASQYPFATLGAAELTLRFACETKAIIIDLTQNGEMGIGAREAYCPAKSNDVKVYSHMTIEYIAQEDDGAMIYEVVDSLLGKSATFKRYQCNEWEDHTAPTYELLNRLVKLMERYPSQQKLVHCKAGVGRTGTLLACYMLAERITSGIVNQDNAIEEVVKAVGKIRLQRCSTCVETKAQFDQIMDFVCARLEEIRVARGVVAAPAVHAAADASGV